MTESQTPNAPQHGRSNGLQTKALAGLVAVMLAAAIVALVFVTNGSGSSNSNNDRAGGQPSDVGRMSSAAPATASPSTSSPTRASSSKARSTSPSSTSAGHPAPSSTAAKGGNSSASTSSPSASSSHSTATKKVVYTVKKGDTLSAIGKWYSDHGYLKLYNWNKSVIGENPDLIFPGQKIIVVDGNVGVARHSH